MMPPSSKITVSAANLRKLELENNNLELELEYSRFINSHAESILEEKALKDTNSFFCNSIRNIHEDLKSLREKYQLIETRINDVKALHSLSDYIDIVKSNSEKQKGL